MAERKMSRAPAFPLP